MAQRQAVFPMALPEWKEMAMAAASISEPVTRATNGAGPNNGSPTPPGFYRRSPQWIRNNQSINEKYPDIQYRKIEW